MNDTGAEPRTAPPGVDTSVPSIARVYDAILGGKDNFAADRALLDRMLATSPDMITVVRENRAWQGRVLRWLAAQAGIDQFLDLGSGLPTAQNTHQVVQRVNPEATVVYVDNDPAVLAFGRALLEDNDRTHLVDADLTDADALLAHPAVRDHLDLTRPVAVLLGAALHFVADGPAQRLTRTYVDALAPGSYVALSHDVLPPDDGDPVHTSLLETYAQYKKLIPTFVPRTPDGIRELMPGLEVVEPGLVPVHEWWPAGPATGPVPAEAMAIQAVVARKP